MLKKALQLEVIKFLLKWVIDVVRKWLKFKFIEILKAEVLPNLSLIQVHHYLTIIL